MATIAVSPRPTNSNPEVRKSLIQPVPAADLAEVADLVQEGIATARALARGLVPLHATRGASQAWAASLADAQRRDRTRIEIRSPTSASFAEHGRQVDGRVEIPNVWPRRRTARGGRRWCRTRASRHSFGR